ncbi:MAG: caspase family protein, partial [Bacteroidales bacterium]|nr:caspase family protein [Bacteroidales bacterium]
MRILKRSLSKTLGLSLAAVLVVCSQSVSAATSRVALIIGNADYNSRFMATLKNPLNDSQSMRTALKSLGFKILHIENANQATMENAFRAFGNELQSEAENNDDVVALFYYSGHGAQVNGKNYLLAVNSGTDYQLYDDSSQNSGIVPLTKLFIELNQVETTNIVILDACRDNPLIAKNELTNTAYATKSVRRGLEWLDESTIGSNVNRLKNAKEPTNTIFAFATRSTDPALDGLGVNSPYTKNLVNLIATKGLPVNELL